jgi:hypothetical protein
MLYEMLHQSCMRCCIRAHIQREAQRHRATEPLVLPGHIARCTQDKRAQRCTEAQSHREAREAQRHRATEPLVLPGHIARCTQDKRAQRCTEAQSHREAREAERGRERRERQRGLRAPRQGPAREYADVHIQHERADGGGRGRRRGRPSGQIATYEAYERGGGA